jgi:P4 family phage/plasmid primase-like protien
MTDSKLNKKLDVYRKAVVDYLNEHRYTEESDDKPTHQSWGTIIRGKFTLNKDIKKFMEIYTEAIENGVSDLSILEVQQEYSPIIVDIDLKLPIQNYESNTRLYTNKMIENIIKKYLIAIDEYVNMPSDIKICIFEKELPSETDDVCKDGFHIYFPEIITSANIRHLIRHRVVKMYNEDDNLFEQFAEIPDKIIDKAVVSSNGWLLYGSKKPSGQIYKLTKIYDKKLNITYTHDSGDFTTAQIIKFFSLNTGKRNNKKYALELKDIKTESEIYAEVRKNGLNVNVKPVENEFGNSKEKEELFQQACSYTNMLANDRSDNYEEWRNVGLSLHNTDISLLPKWIEFSKKCKNKYKEGVCDQFWKTFKIPSSGNLLTIRSLAYWAKQDSPKEYEIYTKDLLRNKLKDSLDNNTYKIAMAFFTKYKDRFACSSMKSNIWWEFENHRWNRIEEAYSIRKILSEEFANEYYEEITETTKTITKESGFKKEQLQHKLNTLNKITEKLMNIDFKKKIIEEAKALFFDKDFDTKLDSNVKLIGFNNGVYDLASGKFREGTPDDYISLSTKNDYRVFSNNMPYIKEIIGFFNQVLPNEKVRNYFLQALSTCLSGETKEEKLYILTGCGSNGKSLTMDLMCLALGDYYMSCPITIITRKRGSSNETSPEKVRMKGKRCGVFQETDDGEKLNVGVMKEFTGGDKVLVRDLFKGANEMIEFKPQMKYFLTCNQLPAVPSNDDGTWRRLRVIEFKSKFTDNPTKSNEFKINTSLKDDIKKWAPYVLSYLLHIYETQYKGINYLAEPEEVLASTNQYKMENDFYTEYFLDKITMTEDPKDTISRENLYTDFKKWYMVGYDTKIVPKKPEFEKIMYKLIGEPHPRKGYIKVIFTSKTIESSSDNEISSPLDVKY